MGCTNWLFAKNTVSAYVDTMSALVVALFENKT